MNDKELNDFLEELENMILCDEEERAVSEKTPDTKIVYKSTERYNLDFTVGTDEDGNDVVCNLVDAPHLFVCGEDTDKMIKNILVDVIENANVEIKLVLCGEPDNYECFQSLPHLIHGITFDDRKIEGILRYLVNEMENRFYLFEGIFVRNLKEYRAKTGDSLPYIVVVIDGFEKLRSINYEIPNYITRLTQKARAAGIHIIIGAKNMDARTVSGYLLNNVPCRIAFKVKDKSASMVSVTQSGAEKLTDGKLMYLSVYSSQPKTLNCPVWENKEVVYNDLNCDFGINKRLEDFLSEYMSGCKETSEDLINKAKEAIDQFDTFFVATFQRKMKIGFYKATMILSQLERDGYITRDGIGKPYRKTER